jgi:hypothetical protein
VTTWSTARTCHRSSPFLFTTEQDSGGIPEPVRTLRCTQTSMCQPEIRQSLYRLSCRCYFHDSHVERVTSSSTTFYLLRHICPSVCPHGATRLPIDGFLWNFTFDFF